MTLKQTQLNLLHHLCQFGTLDYESCLWLLDTRNTRDKTAMSYIFRPLTKNKYIPKHTNGSVTILAKGRALFPNIEPLVTLGGGSENRVNSISRTAAFLRSAGIKIVASHSGVKTWCFVPSTCQRKIRHGILSTTRFTGMLFVGNHRLAVYDIGDGSMDRQLRAERSLFYRHYERVFLTTPSSIENTLDMIAAERDFCIEHRKRSGRGYDFSNDRNGDFYYEPRWYFANLTTDLLKFVYFFVAVRQNRNEQFSIIVPPEDSPIVKMYPQIMKEVEVLEYRENKDGHAHD
jgi:hypothetical protein